MDELEVKPDERLRPCPFCGSAVAPYVGMVWDSISCHYRDHQWQVVCNFNKGGCGGSSGVRDSEYRAIELWNRKGGAPWVTPSTVTHAKPDTWERIIEDAIREGFERTNLMAQTETNTGVEDFVARCRALAGEVEE